MLARGFPAGDLVRAMHDASFAAAGFLAGVWPDSMPIPWWRGDMLGVMWGDREYGYFVPSRFAEEAARTLCGGGYTLEDLPASCRNLGTLPAAGTWAAVAIARLKFTSLTPQDLQSRLVAAGLDQWDVKWTIKFLYLPSVAVARMARFPGRPAESICVKVAPSVEKYDRPWDGVSVSRSAG